MNKNDFEEMFNFGLSGEKIVGSWLGTKNVTCFGLHPFDLLDHGPRIAMNGGETVPCPDFICWGIPPVAEGQPADAQGDQFFVEVKRFKKWWDETGTLQTGIEENKVREYKQLAAATGKRVFIYFLQVGETMCGDGLFCGDISTLNVAGVTTPGDKTLSMFNKTDLAPLANADALRWHDPTDRPEDEDLPGDDEPPSDEDDTN